MEGALDFLHAAGFVQQEIDGEEFLLWMPKKESSEEALEDLRELLSCLGVAEIIPLEVDRNLQVLLPSQARRLELPDDFYRMTPEEMKKEQKLRADALEQSQMLRTKAMREREEQRALTMYRFAFIRVRFPDGIYIQGTFSVKETIKDVYDFVQACLKHEEAEFGLTGPAGSKLRRDEDRDRTLMVGILLQHCKQVLGVEIIEEAVRDAKFNAEANQVENCKFFAGDADDFITSFMHETGVAGQDVLAIVDPPRAGLRKWIFHFHSIFPLQFLSLQTKNPSNS